MAVRQALGAEVNAHETLSYVNHLIGRLITPCPAFGIATIRKVVVLRTWSIPIIA
jgi:hypothetical protein